MTALATAHPFVESIRAEWSWWVLLDAVEIGVVTVLLLLRDLSTQNRPFDWLPVIFTFPFALLTLIQGFIVSVALLVLVGLNRATLNFGADAWWIALAGLSLLKSLPGGGQGQGGQQLWSLADWLFKKFYGDLRLEISRQSKEFRAYLLSRYNKKAAAFLADTLELVDAIDSPADAVTDKADVTTSFSSQPSDLKKVEYLATWVSPRTTRKRWQRVAGK